MNTVVRRTLETAARVREFLRAHTLEGTSFTNALGRFEVILARAQGLVTQQREGDLIARAASARRMELRLVLQKELLRHLVRVGVVAAKDQEGLGKRFAQPKGSHLAYLTAVKAMLVVAEAHKDALMAEGMSETLLEDLDKAVAGFEAASEASRAGQRTRVGARKELYAIMFEVTERIRLLDGLVRYRFRNDGELLGAWISASNVPNPPRAKKPVNPEGGVVPPSIGGTASAA